MENSFFEHPILNSPYRYPARHWELMIRVSRTQQVIESRRGAEFITPIPKPRKRRAAKSQQQFVFDEGKGLSTQEQQYDVTAMVNEIRRHVDQWRTLPHPRDWGVTSETARLLQHWRHHQFSDISPSSVRWEQRRRSSGSLRLPQVRADRPASSRPPRQRQQRRQPRAVASSLEACHRCRQDHRHGHDHRMADHQRRPAPQQQALHTGFPDGSSKHHHQRPPASASAQRPRQLLR